MHTSNMHNYSIIQITAVAKIRVNATMTVRFGSVVEMFESCPLCSTPISNRNNTAYAVNLI